MATARSLSNLVELSLGTPEVGVVNFNALTQLLHAIVTKLDLLPENNELANPNVAVVLDEKLAKAVSADMVTTQLPVPKLKLSDKEVAALSAKADHNDVSVHKVGAD